MAELYLDDPPGVRPMSTTHEPSELLYTTESPALTAAELARQTITDTMAANARMIRERLDNDDE